VRVRCTKVTASRWSSGLMARSSTSMRKTASLGRETAEEFLAELGLGEDFALLVGGKPGDTRRR
jgi:hypothetical protein